MKLAYNEIMKLAYNEIGMDGWYMMKIYVVNLALSAMLLIYLFSRLNKYSK